MKTKSEIRRRLILDVAIEVFREEGFMRASMSEICSRVGGSKATLYNYFPSKEALFLEVVLESNEEHFEMLHQSLNTTAASVDEVLAGFGENLLMLIFSPRVLEARRLMISEAARSNAVLDIYQRSRGRGQKLVAAYLHEAMEAGRLKVADPMVAAAHLMALLESELIERVFYREVPEPDRQEMCAVVGRALAVFMAAYKA
jgi:AcrR family transcriptional regulator